MSLDCTVEIKQGGLGLGLTIPHFCYCSKTGSTLFVLVISMLRRMVHVVVVGYIPNNHSLVFDKKKLYKKY